MRPLAVLDSTVVVAGIGWQGDSRQILALLARRGLVSVRTSWLTDEWASTVARVAQEAHSWRNRNWPAWLNWLKRASVLLEDPPMRATIKRDPKDDPVIAAAVAAHATYLVSYDRDLLDLDKPYGVQCLRPHAFLAAVLAKP